MGGGAPAHPEGAWTGPASARLDLTSVLKQMWEQRGLSRRTGQPPHTLLGCAQLPDAESFPLRNLDATPVVHPQTSGLGPAPPPPTHGASHSPQVAHPPPGPHPSPGGLHTAPCTLSKLLMTLLPEGHRLFLSMEVVSVDSALEPQQLSCRDQGHVRSASHRLVQRSLQLPWLARGPRWLSPGGELSPGPLPYLPTQL